MNKANLKSYAPQARRDFIAAVTARANLLGLSVKAGKLEVAASQPQGDATVIAGQAWPVKVHGQRQQLIARIEKDGFAQTMEAVAYTWFNRFAALRYMELHDYLGHGHRALSSTEGTLPDILNHAADLCQSSALPGLKSTLVVEMKLAGNRDGELYRLLLVAQCNALSNVMPFLFERIDDETELLLPDNLLRTDSVIAKLVASIEEEDWKEVEIIGWLYQFYISEKKDEVIGKVVKSEDIPAATQLFTPNWIVQYLVQNSVGRLWLMANPASNLKSQWQYYIEPALQSPEVQAQLDVLIHTRMNEDGGSLNPESITLLDPACGSGHILVEAYEVLKAIYLERGYQPRAIPRLILEKNLFGLDIDDRAAQMAGFALLMKARSDDRRLFNEPVELNVLSLQERNGVNVDELYSSLQTVAGDIGGTVRLGIASLVAIFSQAKTFGSLIQIPQTLSAQLVETTKFLQSALKNGDLYAKAAAQDLWPLVAQAKVLSMQFDAVVANPPYIGNRAGMNDSLKTYADQFYRKSRGDTFAMFIERGLLSAKNGGFASMVTLDSWLSLVTYQDFRSELVESNHIVSLLHMPYEGKRPTAMGINFGVVSFTLQRGAPPRAAGYFARQRYTNLTDDGVPISLDNLMTLGKRIPTSDFSGVPSSAIVYMLSESGRKTLSFSKLLGTIVEAREGMTTADNDKFLRWWFELKHSHIHFGCKSNQEAIEGRYVWFPYIKGGEYRKWFGNNGLVVNWFDDGAAVKSNIDSNTGRVRSHNYNGDYGFRAGMTWTSMSSKGTGARIVPSGFMFDTKGPMLFGSADNVVQATALMNSRVGEFFLSALSGTKDFKLGQILALPLSTESGIAEEIPNIVNELVFISSQDEDRKETSWNFTSLSLVDRHARNTGIQDAFLAHQAERAQAVERAQFLEQRVNEILIQAYGLQDELAPEVLESQITLARADREKDCQRLISYAIGCMMGRYSLDAPGLIYACAGNVGFDASRYGTFPADADGIVPLTDELWFEDEAASRVREFLLAIWGGVTWAENMAWLAESLSAKAGETPDETVRRYLADKFYKDHLQTYKKRPIYWLFSSGKQGAFQALVYLHRYHEGTLSRMRAEYVLPLTGKIQSRIDMLEKDAVAVSSTAARNKLSKEVEKLKKKHVELLAYDEQLRHYADMRIALHLDDGVKVNYGKFGDLLAEVKAVTGGANDD